MSLNKTLFENILHVGFFWYFVICCICVFVCLCICIFVFVCLIHGNIIFDILEHSSFQKYTTRWGFLVLCHMLYLCILYLCVWLMEISFLISLNKPLFKTIQHVGSFWYFVICCICVFVYFVFACLTRGNTIFVTEDGQRRNWVF